MRTASQPIQPLSASRTRVKQALKSHHFFKLIVGASFNEPQRVHQLVKAYTYAGTHAIDIGPHPDVLQQVEAVFKSLPDSIPRPLLMVSLSCDGDPHFRKVSVREADCIQCGVCVPVCPTEALAINKASLDVDSPLCYGCSRCVDVCPTDAFDWDPLPQISEPIQRVLDHPWVEAVELHTDQLQTSDLDRLLWSVGSTLRGKLVALCFRPQEFEGSAIDTYLTHFDRWLTTLGCEGLIQIDGQPMSGSSQTAASLPALEAAYQFQQQFPHTWASRWPITISGGINLQTASYLQYPRYQAIAGVGMGTMARRAVWHSQEESESLNLTQQIVEGFSSRRVLEGVQSLSLHS